MEMHQIRYFLAVVETKSISKAAEHCNIAQPSLSQQLSKLEDELGGSLFSRSRQGTVLSERGSLFLPHAKFISTTVELARADMRRYDGLETGTVRFGCMPGTGTYILPQLLGKFTELYPELLVQLREDSSPLLADSVLSGDTDLAIVDNTGIVEGLQVSRLFEEPLLLACPPKDSEPNNQVNLSFLENKPFILMKTGFGFRKIVVEALAKAGVQVRVVYESVSIETIQALVEAGLGYSLVPKMVAHMGHKIRYKTLEKPVPARTLYVISREGSTVSPGLIALKKLVVNLYAT